MSSPPRWHSLYLPANETIAAALREALSAAGFAAYHPFGLMPGRAYTRRALLFAAPPRDGWTRVLIAPESDPLMRDAAWLQSVSSTLGAIPLLSAILNGDRAAIEAFHEGVAADPSAAFAAYADEMLLRGSLSGVIAPPPDTTPAQPTMLAVPIDQLPGNMQALAGRVDPRQAEKMIARMTGQAAKRIGAGDEADAARALLAEDAAPDWASTDGRRLRAFLAALMPNDADPRQPAFTAVRDAYALHERRRRRPNAIALPGDAEAMRAVPDALAYTPVYAGKNE